MEEKKSYGREERGREKEEVTKWTRRERIGGGRSARREKGGARRREENTSLREQGRRKRSDGEILGMKRGVEKERVMEGAKSDRGGKESNGEWRETED